MPHDLPILYSFRRCPYAMRARLALWQSGVIVELREVVLRDKPAELIAASPKATVPVLVLPSGEVIAQSLDIMHWALAQSDPAAWHPPELAAQQIELITRHDIEFKPLLDAYKYPERHSQLSLEQHRDNAMYWLAENINQRLEGYTYLIDNQMRISDVAIAPFIRQFSAVDFPWFEQHAPAPLQNWLATFTESELLAAVMNKYPQWQAGDAPIYFGRKA
ncbi:glutathione S-transferase N-terminal domain-containing protein [Deefgea rivuli]|uniref:glutathione S-transferase N-terminal domain-containing protein n=1 Tax=Deefgea rivuli TaxID=400948 RepID=UPI0006849ECB|nr:glutathione S-transferase N-terminal domain-containing protein [Deefgea rivuli]